MTQTGQVMDNTQAQLFLLLTVIFNVKHYLADYQFQTDYMLKKHLPNWEFAKPLAAHCAVHAALSALIALGYMYLFVPYFRWFDIPWVVAKVVIFDFACHFMMDRAKASPHGLGQFKALSGREIPEATPKSLRGNKIFWRVFGADQGVHHVTHALITYYLVTWRMT